MEDKFLIFHKKEVMKKVCICGGGNLGHVVTGFLAANGDCEVSLLTRHPERWQHQLEITTPDGEVMKGQVKTISSNPNDFKYSYVPS